MEEYRQLKSIVPLSDDEIEIVMKSKTSLLFDGKDFWKKSGDSDFDIQMGSWDSAESTDVVGMFLLSKVNKIKSSNHPPATIKNIRTSIIDFPETQQMRTSLMLLHNHTRKHWKKVDINLH